MHPCTYVDALCVCCQPSARASTTRSRPHTPTTQPRPLTSAVQLSTDFKDEWASVLSSMDELVLHGSRAMSHKGANPATRPAIPTLLAHRLRHPSLPFCISLSLSLSALSMSLAFGSLLAPSCVRSTPLSAPFFSGPALALIVITTQVKCQYMHAYTCVRARTHKHASIHTSWQKCLCCGHACMAQGGAI